MKLPDASALGVVNPPSNYRPARGSAAGFVYTGSRDAFGPALRQIGSQFLSLGLQKKNEGDRLQTAQANADLSISLDRLFMEQSQNTDYHSAPGQFRQQATQELDRIGGYISDPTAKELFRQRGRVAIESHGISLDKHAVGMWHQDTLNGDDQRIDALGRAAITNPDKAVAQQKLSEINAIIDGEFSRGIISAAQAKARKRGAVERYGKAWTEDLIRRNPDKALELLNSVTPKVGPQSSLKNEIKRFEGFAPTAKWDYKQYTNGYGTRAASPGEHIDRQTAELRLDNALADAAAVVDRVNPNLPPGVKKALISLTFNAGSKWTTAGLGDAIRAGDFETAKKRFLSYNRAGGKYNPGLASRRRQEAAWFDNGTTQMSARSNVPVPTVPQAPEPAQPAQTGTPLDFIAPEDIIRLRDAAEREKRNRIIDEQRQISIERQRRQQESDDEENRILKDAGDPNTPMLTTDQILTNDKLDIQAKERLPGVLRKLTEPQALTDEQSHQKAVDLIRDIARPQSDPQRIDEKGPIFDAFTRGEISKEDFNFVLGKFNARQSAFEKEMDAFFKGVQAQIDHSNPLFGKIDQTGKANFYVFQRDVKAKIAEYEKQNKDPSVLIDPHSSEYLGNPKFLSKYQKTLSQSIGETERMLNPPPGAGSAVVPAVEPRRPGETVEEYMKRMGR